MRTAIVHCHKLLPDGSLDIGFKTNLDTVIRLRDVGLIDNAILTGGRTRKEFLPESAYGRMYLNSKGMDIFIRIEDESKSSAENVIFTKERYGKLPFEKIYAVARKSSMRRLQFLYRYFWKEAYDKAEFVGTVYPQSMSARALEYLYYVIARLDPEEKTIFRLMKWLFR